MKYFIRTFDGTYLNLRDAHCIYIDSDFEIAVSFSRNEDFLLAIGFKDRASAQKYLDDFMDKLYDR